MNLLRRNSVLRLPRRALCKRLLERAKKANRAPPASRGGAMVACRSSAGHGGLPVRLQYWLRRASLPQAVTCSVLYVFCRLCGSRKCR
jgi:hypothetical protein